VSRAREVAVATRVATSARPRADREPGREREADRHAGALAAFGQLCEARLLDFGVGLAPALALQRVVLRRDHVGVHAEAPELLDPPEPVRVRPRPAVEALDDATLAEGRAQ
jgi:hypothetical protein